MEHECWYTVEQVAKRLQVAEVTVRRWLREGLLRGSRLPGKAGWRIPASELERFLRERAGQGLDRPSSES
jgi:excisionase family DNA binding protein